jgi:hypothetical protein
MAKNSEMMIHDAWGLCVGNADDMVKMAGELDHFSDNIASIYAAKAGGDVADWRAAMQAETWYSAQEAVDAGLADRVDTGKTAAGEERVRPVGVQLRRPSRQRRPPRKLPPRSRNLHRPKSRPASIRRAAVPAAGRLDPHLSSVRPYGPAGACNTRPAPP